MQHVSSIERQLARTFHRFLLKSNNAKTAPNFACLFVFFISIVLLFNFFQMLTLTLTLNPLMPVPPVTNLCLSSSSDVITFDQNWHHIYSTPAGGKDLSNDAQIRVIGQIEP